MNEYYLAWLRAGNMCQPLYLFINWCQQKQREFRELNKIPLTGYMLNEKEVGLFTIYINIGPNEIFHI